MIDVLKRSEKLQEKLEHNYGATSRKTAQQLKDVKKKVKDLKIQLAKVSSNSSRNIDASSTHPNSQFCVEEESYSANRKSLDKPRSSNKTFSAVKTISATVSIGKNDKCEDNLAGQVIQIINTHIILGILFHTSILQQ